MKWQGHLVNTDDPLVKGVRVTTQCGVEMEPAKFADMEIIPGELLDRDTLKKIPFMCQECIPHDRPKPMLYFVLDAETLRHFGSKVAE